MLFRANMAKRVLDEMTDISLKKPKKIGKKGLMKKKPGVIADVHPLQSGRNLAASPRLSLK